MSPAAFTLPFVTIDPYDVPSERVWIFDTTLRDGEQAPGFSMTVPQKLRMAEALDALGVDIIEAGFPIASTGDFDAVRAISGAFRRPTIAGLCRAVRQDIECCARALAHAAHARIHVVIATSDLHLQYKLRVDRATCLRQAADAVRIARALCDEVEFSAEDATRSDLTFLADVAEAAAEAGATVINLPDTVGYALPNDIGRMFAAVRARVGDAVRLSAHCHDDLGMAVANSLAALDAGARQVECTVNGIGERAGNASLEEIVMALHVRQDQLPFRTGIVTNALVPSSRTLTDVVGVPVPPNKAIVGANAFAHEAGIHQDGVLKNPLTYEIMRPATVGASGSRIVIGKHSGKRAIDARCREMGHHLRTEALDRVYHRLMDVADTGRAIADADIQAVLQEEACHALVDAPAARRSDALGHEGVA
jgi:2-isopropylmalate synthase